MQACQKLMIAASWEKEAGKGTDTTGMTLDAHQVFLRETGTQEGLGGSGSLPS